MKASGFPTNGIDKLISGPNPVAEKCKESNMTIEERLEKMEKEMRRQKRCNRWLLGAVLLVAGGLVVPAVFETTASRARAQGVGTVKEIRANKILLEDQKGMVRAGLDIGSDGRFLALLDENGKGRAVLDVTKDGPRLLLLDANSKTRAELTVVKDFPNLKLNDENGKTRGGLGVGKDGPFLALCDERIGNSFFGAAWNRRLRAQNQPFPS